MPAMTATRARTVSSGKRETSAHAAPSAPLQKSTTAFKLGDPMSRRAVT